MQHWRDVRDFLVFWWVFDAAIVTGYAANPTTSHSWSDLIGFATLMFGTQPAFLASVWLYFAIRDRTIRPE